MHDILDCCFLAQNSPHITNHLVGDGRKRLSECNEVIMLQELSKVNMKFCELSLKGGGQISLTVKKGDRGGVEGHRIEVEPSSFA